MPPIEVGPARAIGAIDTRLPRKAEARIGPGGTPARADPPVVVRSEALEPGAAPVDADRVAQIRNAIAAGEYPLIPTRIADAMIAAGLLLRNGQ